MKQFAVRAILLLAIVWQKMLPAENAIFPSRMYHLLIQEQFGPYAFIEFRIKGQNALQELIAADGSVLNGGITRVDHVAIVIETHRPA